MIKTISNTIRELEGMRDETVSIFEYETLDNAITYLRELLRRR